MPVMADDQGLPVHSKSAGASALRCELDSKGCVSLKCILDAFNTPLSEEQAWAVCYQTVLCVVKTLDSKDDGQSIYEIGDVSHIRIRQQDGVVHPCSLRNAEIGIDGPRKLALSEYKMINSLGLVIFQATDYGLQEDEEPSLSVSLSGLIDGMTSAGPNDKYARRAARRSKLTSSSMHQRNNGQNRKNHVGTRESDGRERRRRRRTSGGIPDDGGTSSSSASSEEEEVDSSLEDDDEEDEAFHDGDHPDDEGIERDHEDDDQEGSMDPKKANYPHGVVRAKKGLSLQKVLQICASQIPSSTQPDVHYKAVCRALVAEVLELSSFLQKIAVGTKELRKTDRAVAETDNGLDGLRLHDWARLWVQVIRELRQGVKLKKVNIHDHMPHPYEFELTPYEMLLDDIRSRRYNLKKIMVNGDLPPRVKKDAHALILEFIRSRPPLVPASKRVLKPLPVRQPSLYEKLMTSIRQQPKLKPTPIVESSRSSEPEMEKKCEPQEPRRRLIKPDLALRLSASFDDDDDDYDPITPTSDEPMSLPNFPTSHQTSSNNKYQVNSPTSLGYERRHSVSSAGTPDSKSVSSRKSNGSQHSPSTLYSENYWSCSHWRSLECLSLTLEEVVHIRNVLTKAELESVVGNRGLYEDLEKGKICFTCKKIRFSLFGSWGHKCKLCERAVCIKCVTKMKVPTEHFAKIPVYMLSPTPSPPFEKEPSSLPFWKFSDNVDYSDSLELNEEDTEQKGSKSPSATSADDIPTSTTDDSLKENGVSSTATSNKHNWKLKHAESFNISDAASKFRKKAPLMRSKTIQVKSNSPRSPVYDILDSVNGGQKFSGPLVSVCRDCKALVRHIMETSRNPPNENGRKSLKGNASCAPFCLTSVTESPTSPGQSPFSLMRIKSFILKKSKLWRIRSS